jgi:hypothetical protein
VTAGQLVNAISDTEAEFTFTFSTEGADAGVLDGVDANHNADFSSQINNQWVGNPYVGPKSVVFCYASVNSAGMTPAFVSGSADSRKWKRLTNDAIYVGVKMPPMTISSISLSSAVAAQHTQVIFTGTNFHTSGYPFIKVIASTGSCTGDVTTDLAAESPTYPSDAIPGVGAWGWSTNPSLDELASAGQLQPIAPPSDTSATFLFLFRTAGVPMLSNKLCFAPGGSLFAGNANANTYASVAALTISVTLPTHALSL